MVTTVSLESRDVSDLPYEAFVREYVRERKPVVVRDAVAEWPAMRTWTPEYFKATYPTKRVQVSYTESMTFAEFIDGVLASTEDKPGPYMYRLFIHEDMPELLADISPQNRYAFPRRFASPLMRSFWKRPDGYLKLLIGGIGGRFPVMHFDGENAHATVTEIYGDKEFIMYAPSDSAYLYPNPEIPNKSLVVDPHHVDRARFPLQEKATQFRTVLEPGDMVFIPCKWWHTARALTPSISLGTNILDESNWAGFVSEITEPVGFGAKPALNLAYWKAAGLAMSMIERIQRRLPALAPLAPDRSDAAPDPSTLKFKIYKKSED
jgi:hypothetical protein